jgi:predicted methyltransferase MtxX (methanogen marker protein 4)
MSKYENNVITCVLSGEIGDLLRSRRVDDKTIVSKYVVSKYVEQKLKRVKN